MHIHFLDPFQGGNSLIHKTDARVKLLLALAFILTTTLTPLGAWSLYFLLLVLVISLEILSGVGWGYFLKRSSLAIPFVLAALPLLFTVPGSQLFSYSLGSWEISASIPGAERFASIAMKSWISVHMAILLTATTEFPDILVAMRVLRIPRMLVAIFGLMWRYLFVFSDEALRLLRARTARSSVAGIPGLRSGGTITWRAQTAGGLAGNLFVRSLERSERIYAAMLTRGYDGETRGLPQEPLDIVDWVILAIGGGILGLVLLLSGLMGG